MKLTIHRGGHQIGGSVVEVSTKDTRLVVDAGLPLDDLAEAVPKKRPKQPDPLIEKIFMQPVDAIVLSHAHADHSGLLTQIPKAVPLYLSRGTSKMLMAGAIYAGQPDVRGRAQHMLESRRAVQIGDIRVTPFAVDHSAFDSMALLIEADERRLLYSGDLRMHGRKPGMIHTMVNALAPQPLDGLIMEGTQLSSGGAAGLTEYELEKEICSRIKEAPGLVLASFSPMHVDRLVTFFKAARDAGRILVLDVYGAFVMYLAASQSRIPNPQTSKQVRIYYNCRRKPNRKVESLFRGNSIALEEILAAPRDYAMLFRPSMIAHDFAGALPARARCIYSYWQGYLMHEEWQSATAKIGETSGDLVKCHTSGHIHIGDWTRLIESLRPHTIYPIHTQTPERYSHHFENVQLLDDGQTIQIGES